MILCFSGTGNSRYAAEKIAEITGDKLVSINDMLKNNDNEKISVNGNLIFVVPTYAWRIPRVVRKWIAKIDFVGVKNAWFVMTCGSETGNSAKYNKLLCDEKNFAYMGTAQIVMPENYIAMFNSPSEAECEKIIESANHRIVRIADKIKNNKPVSDEKASFNDRFMSGPVNTLFYPMFVKADKFYADEKCTGCGKCVRVCPLNNIQIKDKKPVWNKKCTHCMACISYCPASAVEYGKKTVGKQRYKCER